MTSTENCLRSSKKTPTNQDVFDAQVTITNDMVKYARQLSIRITKLATESILKESQARARGRKYGR